MKKGDLRRKYGFTIVEVSLVIAIAGLIFLMAFVALPSLQRSQRDSRRKDDIAVFLETVKKYQTNNRGALPTNWSGMISQYLGSSFADPDGTAYEVDIKTCNAGDGKDCDSSLTLPSMDHTLHIFVKATCSGERAVGASNPRKIAVMYRLEGSGTYCSNS